MANTVSKTDFTLLSVLGTLVIASLLLPTEAPVVVQESPEPVVVVTAPVTEVIETKAVVTEPEVATLPDFAAIRDVRTKKQAFFDFMLPKVHASNEKVLQTRATITNLQDRFRANGQLSDAELQYLIKLAKRYRVRTTDGIEATMGNLLLKVDVVPESLVLAQAANESGWGTSRFARKANNMFGVWCFKPGCGITPLMRDEGLSHEVASYDSVQESVDAYIHTINTNPAYIMLREIRAEYRADETYMSGLALAEGLEKYSERGLDYVDEIKALIRVNNLQQYTQALISV